MQLDQPNENDDEYKENIKNANSFCSSYLDLRNNNVNSSTNINTSNVERTSLPHNQCPVTETNVIVFIPNLHVSIIITPEIKLHLGVHMESSIKDLTERVGDYFDLESSDFKLLFNDNLKIKDEEVKFSELGLKHNSTLDVIFANAKDDNMVYLGMIEDINTDPNLSSVKTIFVHTKNVKTNWIQSIRVDTETVPFTKHFLGGFKHKKTGIEYHHAVTQTRPRPKRLPKDEMFSRDTQTYKIKNSTIDNVVTTCTQMNKPGYYISNVTDLLILPGRYKTADELEAFVLTKIIIIQKYYRRWLAKKRVEKLRQIRQLILDYESSDQSRKAKDKERRLNELFDKLRSPLYNDDFDLLYHAVEKWRLKQLDNIDVALPVSEQKAIKCRIMDEQHEWLLAIERLKVSAIKVLNFRAKKNKLVKVSKPITWKDKFSNEIQMDLMSTTRGKEVFEIYKSLSMDFFNEEERLDILLTLKRLINNRGEKICIDLMTLINREADLIMRNVSMDMLKGLRTRINTLFLLLCRMSSFNPGVEKYRQVPLEPLDLRGTFQLCRFCNNFLKNTQFLFSVKSKRLGACRTCIRLHNHAMPRQELSPYRLMLHLLQKSEEEYQDNSKMAFIFSEIDIKHLICKVWDAKSILSSNDDLENLTFIRWDVTTEWSPWNTALLTHDEAEAHYKLKDVCAAYDSIFIDKIHQKHILGHNYFVAMSDLAEKFTVHNLKDEKAKLEATKLADKEQFIKDKAERFL